MSVFIRISYVDRCPHLLAGLSPVCRPGGDGCCEWAVVELQGDLESRSRRSLFDQFIGDLHFTTKGVPVLIIGHHILYGKEVSLEKPFAVMERAHPQPSPGAPTEYVVKGLVRRKLLFKTRPKPIIANVPKVV
ncbi:chromosome transmission fidelity protein 8 homolog isoform X2 [Bacillus rossius redtenbacheri]|uniref:chromosome transmission fidelity protein 8 homolog isoform X2 n=1 Tax=Bacillus rossius redtenbacheri TaxID=93214 RepID=UPI002FDCC2F6